MGGVVLDKVKNPYMREQLENVITKFMSESPISGDVYYVHDSGSSGASGKNINSPISTIDAAYNKTIEDNGDVIFVLPNHAETLAAASAIDLDKKGVRIVGLGFGEDRPKITFGTDTGASIEFAADGNMFVNFILIAGIDGLTGPLWVKSEGNVIDVETRDGSSTVEAARWLLSTADADKCVVNTKHIGFPAGDAGVNWARLVGANDWDITIDYYGLASTGVIEFHTTACSNIKTKGQVYNSTTTDYTKTVVDTVTGSTWTFTGFDGETGQYCSGCQDAAISAEDVSAVIAAVAALQTDLGDYSGRTNLQSKLAVDGNPDEAGASLWNSIVGGYGTYSARLGKKVTRAAADIFDGTQKALFTVAGGKVLITHVSIEVTTAAIDNTASNTKLMTNPTVGTDADMCAVLDIDSDEAGSIYSITGEPATALVGGSGGGANSMISPWIVAEGTIDLSTSADAGTGGALGYCEIWYIPLDNGATVVST